MSRRLRAVPLILAPALIAVLAGTAGAASGSPPKLPVSPARGHARTTFTVHFTAPVPSGRSGGAYHAYQLSASPARRRRGCIDSVSLRPVASTAGQAMAVRLVPRSLGGHWCTGTYSGQVIETSGPVCGPPTTVQPALVCPMVLIASRIGDFSFRVTRRP